MSLFSRKDDLPGTHGVLRDCTPKGKGLKRFSQGDIAVIDSPDISRRLAQDLINLRPSAVVNKSAFSTGAVPNFGPTMLLDASIVLIDSAGSLGGLRDGKRGRVTEEGGVYHGDKHLADGHVLAREEAEKTFNEAQRSLVERMEAYFGNTVEFINSEAPLLVDGLGIPDIGEDIQGRKTLVVSPGARHREQIEALRYFIREYEPYIVGVEGAADTLVDMGYRPHLIVGNPVEVGAETLRSGARVVLPADADGHASGLERIQDLGIGAMTFPAATDSATDLALLLVEYHGAELIVNAGAPLSLDGMFAGKHAPAALVTRAKVGTKLVDADSVANLYIVPSGGSLGWLWAILGVLVACAAIVLIAGLGGEGSFNQNLIDTWNNLALTVQGWFKE
ncbi:putative cytokinetic ring protein SteA [Corynebacterium mastitidis]|uniref:Cytokinetic ring protein SteA n=1 Tax=Corynebacterium mastitidis TaxID=161890 RepID=A0ABU8NZB8_9CORY